MSAARISGLIAMVLLSVSAHACAWDYDTVAAEAKFNPEILQAVAGRFDVYPPDYYRIRLQRSATRVKEDPTRFDDYDACAIALDKLGDSSAAIQWLERKRVAMERAKLPPKHDHRYRYHANLGTVLAHQYLRDGSKGDVKRLDQAVRELKAALIINPDAHFGREIVQVRAIELLRDVRSDKIGPSEVSARWHELSKELGRKKVQAGIIGMMAFGGNWDSADLTGMLYFTVDPNDSTIGELVKMRWAEQSRARAPVLFTEEVMKGYPMWGMASDTKSINRAYVMLKSNGEAYRKHVSGYVTTQLAAGKHPDTHPEFWKAYDPVKPLAASDLPNPFVASKPQNMVLVILGSAAALMGAVVMAAFLVKRIRTDRPG